MNDTEKEKIKRFLNDIIMADAVYKVLLSSFLKSKAQADTNVLAAERLAINLLQESWKDLNKYKDEETKEPEIKKQIGL